MIKRDGYSKGTEYIDGITDKQTYPITDIQPYLRPMSSMTEEEREEYHKLCDSYYGIYFNSIDSIDWLNAHHFDYRDLIPKCLALEAPEDMYKKNKITMIKEAYCSFEVAKLLKEKGFDEECTHYFTYEDDELIEYTNGVYSRNSKDCHRCTSPTHQMAMAWLRERNIGIVPEIHTTQDPKNYYWSACIFYLNKPWDILHYVFEPSKNVIDGYNGVIEQALKYSLEKLI